MKEENGKLYYELGDKLYRPMKLFSTSEGTVGYAVEELSVVKIENGVVYLDRNGTEERTGEEYSTSLGYPSKQEAEKILATIRQDDKTLESYKNNGLPYLK